MNIVTARPSGIRRFLTAKFIIPGVIAAVVLAAVILIWFQPQKLFIDTNVDEEAPGAMEKEDFMAKDASMKKDEAMMKDDSMAKGEAMMMSGSFRGLDHETSGTALLDKAPDGHYYIRFENFSTENGPDLFVYLSTVPGNSKESDFPGEFIDLGKLKGNIGNQNYLVPDGADLTKYKSVIIWCRRFNTTFGASPLETKQGQS